MAPRPARPGPMGTRSLTLTALCFAFSAALLVSAFGVQGGLRGQIERVTEETATDVFVVTRSPSAPTGYPGPSMFPLEVLETIRQLPEVADVAAQGHHHWFEYNVTAMPASQGSFVYQFNIRMAMAITPNYFAVRGVPLSEGRSFTSGEAATGAPVAVVGCDAFAVDGPSPEAGEWTPRAGTSSGSLPAVGDRFALFCQAGPSPEYVIVGVLPRTGIRGFDQGIFVPPGAEPFAELEPDLVTVIRPRTEPVVQSPSSMGFALWVQPQAGRLEEAMVRVAAALAEWNTAEASVRCDPYSTGQVVHQRTRETIGTAMYATAGLTLLISSFNAAVLLFVLAAKHVRQLGVKRSLGATRGEVFLEIIVKALALAFLPATIGSVAGLLAAPFLGRAVGQTLAPTVWTGLAAVGATTISASLAGLYPAAVTAAISPARAMRGQVPWTAAPVWRDPRVVLVSLAIAVGVTGVLCTLGIGRSVDAKVAAVLEQAGEDLLVVEAGSPFEVASTGERLSVDPRLASELLAIPGVTGTSYLRVIPVSAPARGDPPSRAGNWSLAAVEPDYFAAAGLGFAAGQQWTDDDGNEPVVVLGSTVAGTQEAARRLIGETVDVGGTAFRVIGVLEPRPRDVVDPVLNRNQTLFIPAGAWSLVEDTRYQVTRHVILVRAGDEAAAGSLLADIPEVLANAHPGLQLPLVRRPAGDLSRLRAIHSRLNPVFSLIAGLAFLLATVGLGNVAMLRAAERARSIGIRRALGATQAEIRRQLLVETMVLAMTGTGLGVGGALAVLGAIARTAAWPMLFLPSWIAAGSALGLASGILGGVVPATFVAAQPPGSLIRGRL
ncbi:MAG: ABC transporter permease [bacterium]|nr:ABC transporter permease [bacterium]